MAMEGLTLALHDFEEAAAQDERRFAEVMREVHGRVRALLKVAFAKQLERAGLTFMDEKDEREFRALEPIAEHTVEELQRIWNEVGHIARLYPGLETQFLLLTYESELTQRELPKKDL